MLRLPRAHLVQPRTDGNRDAPVYSGEVVQRNVRAVMVVHERPEHHIPVEKPRRVIRRRSSSAVSPCLRTRTPPRHRMRTNREARRRGPTRARTFSRERRLSRPFPVSRRHVGDAATVVARVLHRFLQKSVARSARAARTPTPTASGTARRGRGGGEAGGSATGGAYRDMTAARFVLMFV